MARLPKRSWFLLLILLQVILGSTIGMIVTYYYYYSNDFFLPGTMVLGQSVAGLTMDRTEERLMEELVLPEKMGFLWQGQEFFLPLKKGVTFFDLQSEIKRAFDYGEDQDPFDVIRWYPNERYIHLSLEIDSDYFLEGIRSFRPLIDREPVDAKLIVEKGVPFVKPSRLGYSLQMDYSLDTLQKYVKEGLFQGIPLHVLVHEPAITRDDIPDFSYRRAYYSTSIDEEQEDRNHNIALSLASFNAIILEPEEVLSFNERIGKVTKETGYLLSIVIENNRFIEGIGGGICQVATTLYQVALRGELEILARTPHSRQVLYVPGGFDAAVSYNQLDLRFRNNKDYPLLLTSYLDDEIFVSLYGPRTDPGRRVELKSELVQIIPPPVEEVPDPDLPIGQTRILDKGQEGSSYRVYRSIYQDNALESRQLISRDTYFPLPQIIAVGTKLVK